MLIGNLFNYAFSDKNDKITFLDDLYQLVQNYKNNISDLLDQDKASKII
jgi:hypothetical protein